MKCKTCDKELITIYKGVWHNDRTRIEPEFVCIDGCPQEDVVKRQPGAGMGG